MSQNLANPLPPSSTIGILGGGQLGRMLAIAAAELGMRAHIFAPESDPPAAAVAHAHTRAAFTDAPALRAFAADIDILTYEFENIPLAALRDIDPRRIRPSPRSLETTQDRLIEKQFLNALHLPTAPFAPFTDAASLAEALHATGAPAIVKTRRLGYDGKGQYRLRSQADIPDALRALNGQEAIAEGVVEFSAECALALARREDGATAAFPLTETFHENGILRRALAPADMHPALRARAEEVTAAIADALGHIGVLTAEFFLLGEKTDGANAASRLLVNEIAPRVHNSAHWTLEACAASQFAQHIRAVSGWPLGDTDARFPVEMRNLLGDESADWLDLAAAPDASLHLYGKTESRPGRKMGHLTMRRSLPA